MKFKDFLNEETDITKTELQKKCRQFLTDLKKQGDKKTLLGSGRKNKKNVLRKKVRKNRIPLDTPLEAHNMLDEEFKKKFGVKARSQSLFCLSSPIQTVAYGTPYTIFPIGKYKLLYSPKVDDLFDEISNDDYVLGLKYKDKLDSKGLRDRWETKTEKISEQEYQKGLDYIKTDESKEELRKHIKKMVDSYIEIDASQLPSVDKNNEIMLVCDETIQIRQDYFYGPTMQNILDGLGF